MVTRTAKSQTIRAMVWLGKGGFPGVVVVAAWLAAACAPVQPPTPADVVSPSSTPPADAPPRRPSGRRDSREGSSSVRAGGIV